MAGSTNKANGRQASKTKARNKAGYDKIKRRRTIDNKIRRLKRHLRKNLGDNSAKKALKRWSEEI